MLERISGALTLLRDADAVIPAMISTPRFAQGARVQGILQKFEAGSEMLTRGLSAARGVATAGRVLSRAISGGGASGTQASLDALSTAIEGIDIAMPFAKAVPIFGTIWDAYLQPFTEACVKQIRVLAHRVDHDNRQLTLAVWWRQPRPDDATPIIPAQMMQFFPGGQPVLNVMFPLANGGTPVMTPDAETFLLGKQDLLNAGAKRELRGRQNLMSFLRENKDRVWAMLYGDLPQTL